MEVKNHGESLHSKHHKSIQSIEMKNIYDLVENVPIKLNKTI